MSKKTGLGKIAIVVFFTAIIIEIWLIDNYVPLQSLLAGGKIENDLSISATDGSEYEDTRANEITENNLSISTANSWEEENTLADEITENSLTSNILMKDDFCEDSDGKYYGTVLGSKIGRNSIASVTFVDTLDAATDNAWDVSREQNGTVMAWTEPDASNDQVMNLFIGAEGKIVAEDCRWLFRGYDNVKSIEFNDCFDTSYVMDMAGMFQGCKSLLQLDLSNFDTSQVMDMRAMLNQCESLTQLNVSNFDTSQVMDMGGMFCDCKSLMQLDLSNFDTSQVTDMYWMFMGCESLTQLDLSNFDTSQVTNMVGMFWWCGSLSQLDVSNFDTSQVTDMEDMFGGCKSLRQLDVSNFITSQVTNMDGMFEDCGVTAEEANLWRP